MKYAVLFFILIFIPGVSAQPPKPKASTAKKPAAAKPKPAPTPTPLSEKEQFEKASAHELAADRVAALEKFLAAFPESQDRTAAADLMASSRTLIAEEKLLSGEVVEAVRLFKLAITEAPQPIPAELFNESIAKVPATLFRHGQRSAAFAVAALIEGRVESNIAQLVELANFYIGIENGAEAMRIAAKAAAKDPASAVVYRTLGLAHRINFDIEESANAYAKALELEPDSSAAKRGLAEMKRALGKPNEAAALYRDLLAKNDQDLPARTGLVLSLFDADKRAEAETELTAALERAPGNFVLLAGAAYWYASRGIGDKAAELAEKALAREPRYIWSHIALARGLMSQRKPVVAEQVLVKARAHGNFPTLEYELASARVAAGFYREAAEDLSRQFSVTGAGVKTNLGGRVAREEKSFLDLVAYERKASIFTPIAADTLENAETLRALLELDQKMKATEPNEADIASAADAFVKGTDKMKLHRQIYAASLLLQKRVALSKVLELAKAATGNTDAALEVAAPGAAVMASELYDSRLDAFRKNEFLLVPEVPMPTLSAILRGRIEEIAGWALYQQGNYPDAIVRLRRSITVIPDKSAWWRSSMWRLGAALAADGKDAEALNAYIESYKTDKPDFGKYAVVEALYRKVNGTTDGLEAKIGPGRVAILQTTPEIAPAPTASATPVAVTQVETSVTSPAVEPAASAVENKSEPVESKTQPIQSKPEPVEAKPADTKPEPVEAKPEPIDTKPEPEPVESKPRPTESKPEPTESKPEPTVEKEAPPRTEPTSPEKQEPVETGAGKPKTIPDVSTPAVKPERESPEPVKQTPPETEPSDVRSKPAKAIEESGGKSEKLTTSAATKPLFEPIIITIPGRRPPRPAASETTKTSTDEKKTSTDEKPVETNREPDRAAVSTGSARPRVIEGREVKVEEPEPCVVDVSQENVSLINGGGKVGILVHVDRPGDIKTLIATSSSPKDVEVILEPEIGGVPDGRFYVIRSISSAVGVYQVAFSVPCGKKELIVTVR
jgi:tetratricopeptide (TPR) repeat protein